VVLNRGFAFSASCVRGVSEGWHLSYSFLLYGGRHFTLPGMGGGESIAWTWAGMVCGWGCWHLWELCDGGNIMGGKYMSTPGTGALHGCF
jgi:hypothetical protein